MFKFARYFFLVFLITTVIPLLLMFFWTHHQMESMMHQHEQHMNNISIIQLKNYTNQYLKIQEGNILEKLRGVSPEKMSLSQLNNIFKADKIEWVYDKNINKVTSYYEVLKDNSQAKPVLYGVSVLPFENSKIKGIKIIKKVDINQLRPLGHFDLEIYYGNKIEKNSYKDIITNHFPPLPEKFPLNFQGPHPEGFPPGGPIPEGPPPDNFSSQGFPPNDLQHNRVDRIPNNADFKPNSLNLTNINGETVALLVLLPPMHYKPHGPFMPFDNLFGLIVLLAGIVMSLLTGFYINDNFVKPLMSISDASKKVQNGDLSSELSTKNIKQKNILDTYNNFNKMIIGLRDKEKLRKNFISNLTHDLRTPLIAQEKSLELISNKFEQLESRNEFELAKSLERNNHHLLRMVNLILESYSFDEGSLNLTITKINIFELINGCYETLKPLILEKDIQFFNNVPKDFPMINADLTSLKRIFLNLISNAVENIQTGGSININAEMCGNSIKICVEDNGNGISEQDLLLIFDRFYTGKSFNRKLGSGLGLDVCKKLVELHKGEIKVESKLNEYTKFTTMLPLDFQGDN